MPEEERRQVGQARHATWEEEETTDGGLPVMGLMPLSIEAHQAYLKQMDFASQTSKLLKLLHLSQIIRHIFFYTPLIACFDQYFIIFNDPNKYEISIT